MNNPSWTEEMFCVRFPYIPLAKFLSFHRAKKTSRDGSRFLIDRCYENKQFARPNFSRNLLDTSKSEIYRRYKIVLLRCVRIFLENNLSDI